MPVSRRRFLAIVGSSALIFPATSACAFSPATARQPWVRAGQYEDPMRRALSFALLAPNPHNRQPWHVDLKSETEAVLYCDLQRLLPHTDPFSRQIVIGLGCFLEQFRIAAAHFGLAADITPFPDGADDMTLDKRPVAHLSLAPAPDTPASPLFAQILNRRTNRNLYSEKTPGRDTLQKLTHGLGRGISAAFTKAPQEVEKLRSLAIEASNIEFDTKRTYMESVDVMRIGARQINKNPDGIALEGPMMEALHSVGIVTRKTLSDQSTAAFRTGRENYAKGISSARVFIWIITKGNTRLDQIRAGAAYLRLNLGATEEGLAMHPLSQALQEYPEMSEALARLHAMLGIRTEERIQMFARIGYARKVPPAPRWPLETRLKS